MAEDLLRAMSWFATAQGKEPEKQKGAGRGSKSPRRNRDNLVCQGPETSRHTSQSGKDKVIRGNSGGTNGWKEHYGR